MITEIERCSRCFTLRGSGFLKRIQLKRQLRKEGHIIFSEVKRNGQWELCISAKVYQGAIAHERK